MDKGDLATWAGVLLSVLSAVIALGSMNAARRNADAAERQAGSARRSADAAEEQAKSAQRSADAAERQADAADVAAKSAHDQITVMQQQVQNDVDRMNREDRPDFEVKSRLLQKGMWGLRVTMIKGQGTIRVHPVWFARSNSLHGEAVTAARDMADRLHVVEGQTQQVVLGEDFDILVSPPYQSYEVMEIQVHLHCVEVGGMQRSWLWLRVVKLPGPFRSPGVPH